MIDRISLELDREELVSFISGHGDGYQLVVWF